MKYALIVAPGGSGLKYAAERIVKAISDRGMAVAHQDVEDVLCESYEVHSLLRGMPVPTRPTMGHVTRYLPRNRVITLWKRSLRQALNSLALDAEEQESNINILTCHLGLYGGRRRELYSPLDIQALMEDGHRPSHVLLLIDDIYDMYFRLSRPTYLYDETSGIEIHLLDTWRDKGETGPPAFPPGEEARLAFEWRISVLSSLIAWRRAEMLTAEALAHQVEARYLVYGVKHRASAIAGWLTGQSPISVYVSHPITRPRKEIREKGRWPLDRVVEQCNELPASLEPHVTCVMPTAIDEFRIARKKEQNGLVARLDTRWPIPTSNPFRDTLYWLPVNEPPSDENAGHRDLLSPQSERAELEDADLEQESGLRMLANAIGLEVSFRDHHLVANTDCLLVFRPFYGEGGVSRGVAAEVEHWRSLAETDAFRRRRVALVHFVDDVVALLDRTASREVSGVDFFSYSVVSVLVRLLEQSGYSRPGIAQYLIQKLLADSSFASLLDTGVVPPDLQSDLRDQWEALKRQARLDVLSQQLTLVQMPLDRAGIWILQDSADLQANVGSVGQFLSGQAEPPVEWRMQAERLLESNEEDTEEGTHGAGRTDYE